MIVEKFTHLNMRKSHLRQLLSIFIGTMVVALNGATATEWSVEDLVEHEAKQIHHWGQKGEASPNNGWSGYTTMTLDLGGNSNAYSVYRQGNNEISIEVYEKGSDNIKLRAISIPGAGIFYSAENLKSCAPDPIERVGLYAELALHNLSLAFPSGPDTVTSNTDSTASINVQPVELRFMQGVMTIKTASRQEVRIDSAAPRQFKFSLINEKRTGEAKVQWEKKGTTAVVPDSESLEGWTSCWSGVFTTNPDGKRTFKANIDSTPTIKTFGDIRRALNMTSNHTVNRDAPKAARPLP